MNEPEYYITVYPAEGGLFCVAISQRNQKGTHVIVHREGIAEAVRAALVKVEENNERE